jgi:hypothetical protein
MNEIEYSMRIEAVNFAHAFAAEDATTEEIIDSARLIFGFLQGGEAELYELIFEEEEFV